MKIFKKKCIKRQIYTFWPLENLLENIAFFKKNQGVKKKTSKYQQMEKEQF